MAIALLKSVHGVAHRVLRMRGYEFELRRSGETSLGLWRKRFTRPSPGRLPRSPVRRMVFVPGFGDTPLGWLALFGVLGPLIRRHYDEIVLLDYPGFGGFLSAEKCFDSVDRLSQAVGDVFDELRPETLIGHSLGGYLCALYCVLCGEGRRGVRPRADGAAGADSADETRAAADAAGSAGPAPPGPQQLVLLDPSGVFGTPAEFDAFIGRFRSAARDGFDGIRPHVFGKEPTWFRFVQHEFARFFAREDVGQFLETVRPDHALTERLHFIRARTCLIWGERDTLVPTAHLSIWLGALTGARARGYLIRGAGHSPHIERPAVTAAVLAHLIFEKKPHRWLAEAVSAQKTP